MTYEEIIRQVGKQIEPKVYYYLNNNKIEIDRDDFKLAKPKFNAKLLGTVMQGLELELRVPLFNTAIYLEITAIFGGWIATKTYGPYYFKEIPTYNADTKTYTHNLYDQLVKTMVDYEPIKIDYPCTIYNYFKKLVETLELTTNVSSLINGNLTMQSDIYTGIDFTYRDALEDIAQANGVLFYIEGKDLKIAELGNENNKAMIDDDILRNCNIDFGKHFGPINTIVLSRSADSDSIFLDDSQSVLQYGRKELKISDNQLMNDNNRSDFLPALLNRLKGIEYDIFDTELVGFGGFEPLQKVEFETGNNNYSSYVFNNEIEITQGYKEVIYTDPPQETTTDYKASDKTDKRVNQLYIIANKQDKRITALASEVTENKEKTNILEMTVDQTKQTISKVETTVEEIKTTTQTSEGGNHLYLKKVLEQDALEYYIKGKSEQDTRSGKNYIDSSKFIAKSSNGMTALSNEDGSIKFSGTTTNLTNFWFNELNEKLKAGTYKFVTNVDLTNKGRYTLIDNTSGSNVTIINHTKTNSFTISEDMTLTTILIQINADITLNNDFYIMLINDSETEDYEKYGSSPNPKYPSEIKSIAQNGIAKLRITGKNLLNAPYNKENKLTRTATKNDDYQSTDFFAELEAGKQYTFSCKTTGTFGIGNSYQTECYLLLDKKYGYILSMGNKDKYTFTVNQSGKFYLRTDVNIKGETHSFFDFQIEEGEEVTTYEEYKEKEVLIDLNKYDDDGNIVGNYELSSLPNGTSNDLNIVDGQVVLTQNIEKIVLNGSESWIKDSIPKESPRWYCKNYNALMVTPINNDTKAVALSNIGIVSATDTAFETANGLAIHPNGSIYISLDAKILLDNSEEITLYYELKEPKQIVLPNIQIPIFEGVNHVSLVDDIETNTSIKFLCENPYSEYYALNKDLDKTNSNLSNTNHQLGQAQSDINATNTHLNNDFYDKNQIDSMQTSTEQLITQIKNQVEMTTNSTNLQISVLQEKLINGITSVVTETGYKFDKDGLSISKTGEPMKSVLDNEGLIVYRDTTIKLKVSGDEVYTDNLIVNTYFIQKPIRREQGVSISDGKSIGVVEHWIGSGN